MERTGDRNSYQFSRLDRWPRKLVCLVSPLHANFKQMAVPHLLPVRGRDPARPSCVAGLRLTVKMGTGKYEGRFTSAMFSKIPYTA